MCFSLDTKINPIFSIESSETDNISFHQDTVSNVRTSGKVRILVNIMNGSFIFFDLALAKEKFLSLFSFLYSGPGKTYR